MSTMHLFCFTESILLLQKNTRMPHASRVQNGVGRKGNISKMQKVEGNKKKENDSDALAYEENDLMTEVDGVWILKDSLDRYKSRMADETLVCITFCTVSIDLRLFFILSCFSVRSDQSLLSGRSRI